MDCSICLVLIQKPHTQTSNWTWKLFLLPKICSLVYLSSTGRNWFTMRPSVSVLLDSSPFGPLLLLLSWDCPPMHFRNLEQIYCLLHTFSSMFAHNCLEHHTEIQSLKKNIPVFGIIQKCFSSVSFHLPVSTSTSWFTLY